MSVLSGHQGGLKGGLFCSVPVCQQTPLPSRWVEGWSVLCCTCLSIHCGHQSGLKGGLFCAVPVCQYTVAIKVG